MPPFLSENEELMEFKQQNFAVENNRDSATDVDVERIWTENLVADFVKNVGNAIDIVTENAPNIERSTKAKKDIYNMIYRFTEMFRDRKLQVRQSTLEVFFKKKTDIKS
jgi:hypothetical protein